MLQHAKVQSTDSETKVSHLRSKKTGASLASISDEVGVHKSTLSRELRRNVGE
ncbi:MAG TPA: helix-turn-helix domain-containing protein [Gammaproteobacteria bacterium]|nr:helix-turn-helix domain-containing protein [Gammaproteobacteria bacterium]HQZ88349.1 helix-turn-helix domain-containing protein [Gammaproteobacteria bacterium]